MPFIINVAAADIPSRFHPDPGQNSMLISISDPGGYHPVPAHQFNEIHNFEFLDVERNDPVIDPTWKCSQEQADQIVALLQKAKENNTNVVVHCMAGICRSGAVAEVGAIMGFEDSKRFRSPNLLVKHQMMKSLGLTYDENEKSDMADDWRNFTASVDM